MGGGSGGPPDLRLVIRGTGSLDEVTGRVAGTWVPNGPPGAGYRVPSTQSMTFMARLEASIWMMRSTGSRYLMLFRDVVALSSDTYETPLGTTFEKVHSVAANARVVTWMDLQTMTDAAAAQLVLAVLANDAIMNA